MKRIVSTVLIVLFIILCVVLFAMTSHAESNPYGEPFLAEATYYCDDGITASGKQVRSGIAAAKKEWIGKTAILYEADQDGSVGQLIGIYEIEDTGGDQRIKDGKVIDIYLEDYGQCVENGRVDVYVQIVDAKG